MSSGRKKNMIKSGGISIFPEEIEEVLAVYPGLADVAVICLPASRMGRVRQSFGGRQKRMRLSEPESMIRFCKERLASTRRQSPLKWWPALPRTALGKIDRGNWSMRRKRLQRGRSLMPGAIDIVINLHTPEVLPLKPKWRQRILRREDRRRRRNS